VFWQSGQRRALVVSLPHVRHGLEMVIVVCGMRSCRHAILCMARDGTCDKLCFVPFSVPWVEPNEYMGLPRFSAYAVAVPWLFGTTAQVVILCRVVPCDLELFEERVMHLFLALFVGLSGCFADYMVDGFGAFFDFCPHGVEAHLWVDVEFF
jgi:hypothetical protein